MTDEKEVPLKSREASGGSSRFSTVDDGCQPLPAAAPPRAEHRGVREHPAWLSFTSAMF